MKKITLLFVLFSCSIFAQKKKPVYDDFGGQSTIDWWSYPPGESEFTQNETDPIKNSNSVGLFYKNKNGNQELYHGFGATFNENFKFKDKTRFTVRVYVSNISAITSLNNKTIKLILKNSEDESNIAYIEKTFETGQWQTIVFDLNGKLDQNNKPILKNKEFNTVAIEILSGTRTPGKIYIDDFSFGNDLKEYAD